MFKKVKPEKIAGIVALSYLVLIPVGGAIMFRKIYLVEQDLTDAMDALNLPTTDKTTLGRFRDRLNT